jgi:hypothetical protein
MLGSDDDVNDGVCRTSHNGGGMIDPVIVANIDSVFSNTLVKEVTLSEYDGYI